MQVLVLYGVVKFLTPLSSSSHSNGSYNTSMTTSSPRERKIMENQLNLESHSPQDILLVFSAQLFLILLILFSLNWLPWEINLEASEKKLESSTNKLDLKDCGLVSLQELL